MTNEESQFRRLMSEMIDGDLSAAGREDLARLCAADPERAEWLRSELELDEMIRHLARGDASLRNFFEQLGARMIAAPIEVDGTDLIGRLLDGDSTGEEINELVKLCWRDAAFADRVRRELMQDDWLHQVIAADRTEEAFLTALETRMWAEQAEDPFVDELASKIVSIRPVSDRAISIPLGSGEGVNPSARRSSKVHSIIALTGGWAAAAGAVFLLGLAIQFQPQPGAPMESVAEVTGELDGVRWDEESAPVENRYFSPGRYALESGVVTLTFGSGAEMTVEGPAEFEVKGEYEAFVHQGVAVLAKNEASQTSGFHLGTEALNLGDSGETIGVVADGSSSAEAVVFDGGAKVCLPKLGFCRDLFALEPVKADLNREKLFDIPYNPNVFARAWQANAGIERNTGAMKVAMPGESVKAGEGESGVRLSVEKLRFTANEDIEVDTLEPGQFKEVAAGGGSKMTPAGRQFRSYLLQWDSEKGILTKDGEPVEASVTFDHEIVGVIYSPERLAESDELVGVSAAAVTERVSKMIANGNVEGDQILLSDDRRTVNLKLNGRGGAERLDHVRVIVALN